MMTARPEWSAIFETAHEYSSRRCGRPVHAGTFASAIGRGTAARWK